MWNYLFGVVLKPCNLVTCQCYDTCRSKYSFKYDLVLQSIVFSNVYQSNKPGVIVTIKLVMCNRQEVPPAVLIPPVLPLLKHCIKTKPEH